MRFSIVAPNLNESPYLEHFFLRSLKAQSFKDFEVIIVDGGSNPEDLEAINKYGQIMDIKLLHDPIRNIGYIRNVGCKHAEGEILVNTSSDIYFPPFFLKELNRFFREHPETVALGGRAIPHGSHLPLITYFAYGAFDLLRFLMTCRFMPIKKIRPAGNCLAIRKDVFKSVDGYPEVKINEDGLLGYKLDEYWKQNTHKSCVYSLNFKVWHHVKRFEKQGGLKTVGFYFYVLGLVFPFLRRFLNPLEMRSAKEFSNR